MKEDLQGERAMNDECGFKGCAFAPLPCGFCQEDCPHDYQEHFSALMADLAAERTAHAQTREELETSHLMFRNEHAVVQATMRDCAALREAKATVEGVLETVGAVLRGAPVPPGMEDYGRVCEAAALRERAEKAEASLKALYATGAELDATGFDATAAPAAKEPERCEVCGKEHHWDDEDAPVAKGESNGG